MVANTEPVVNEFTSAAGTTLVWLIGIALLVTVLEFAPKLGGALLLVIVTYLALQLPRHGAGR